MRSLKSYCENMMKICPNCRQSINATAIVDAFNVPDAWVFWGAPGSRWIVCREPGFTHFRVAVGHGMQHRLAVIRGHAQDWTAADRNGDLLDASRNHVNKLDHDAYAKQEDWL